MASTRNPQAWHSEKLGKSRVFFSGQGAEGFAIRVGLRGAEEEEEREGGGGGVGGNRRLTKVLCSFFTI